MGGSNHKIENAKSIAFFRFIKPMDPSSPIPGEFEEELFFMASVNNMPDKTRNMMSVRPGEILSNVVDENLLSVSFPDIIGFGG